MDADLKEALKGVASDVGRILSNDGFPSTVYPECLCDAVRSYPMRGGKRVRPALLLWACGALGGDPAMALNAAAAVEATDGWVSIGDIHLRSASGDVNKIISGTSGRIYWHPEKDWPEGGDVPNVRAVVTAWATNSPPNYLVIDFIEPYNVRFYTSPEAFPEGNCTGLVYKTEKLVMRRVPAAGVEWMMGSPSGEYGRENVNTSAKETRHAVTLNEDFYIGIFPVTAYQLSRSLLLTPSSQKEGWARQARDSGFLSYDKIRGSTSEGVDWPTTDIYTVGPDSVLKKLRNLLKFTFDIPTEAQWEYACRAGTGTALNIGITPANAEEILEYRKIVGHVRNGTTAPAVDVGSTVPNAWGIYDMHGTVARTWCRDWFTADLGSEDDTVGNGPVSGEKRVLRGPSYGSYDNEIRSANRHKTGGDPAKSNTGSYTGDIGFRLWLPVTLY